MWTSASKVCLHTNAVFFTSFITTWAHLKHLTSHQMFNFTSKNRKSTMLNVFLKMFDMFRSFILSKTHLETFSIYYFVNSMWNRNCFIFSCCSTNSNRHTTHHPVCKISLKNIEETSSEMFSSFMLKLTGRNQSCKHTEDLRLNTNTDTHTHTLTSALTLWRFSLHSVFCLFIVSFYRQDTNFNNNNNNSVIEKCPNVCW